MTRRLAFGRTALLGAGLAVMAVTAWWAPARLHPPPMGVVIITLDTTRADRLSSYGYMNVSLPTLERLAREGVVFDQATSVAPLTLPAHTVSSRVCCRRIMACVTTPTRRSRTRRPRWLRRSGRTGFGRLRSSGRSCWIRSGV